MLFASVAGMMFVLAGTGRVLARRLARELTGPERCLIVGEPSACEDLAIRLGGLEGVDLVGVCANDRANWRVPDVAGLIEQLEVHRLVLNADHSWSESALLELIRNARWLGVRVSLMPSVITVIGASTTPDSLDSMVLLRVPRFGLSRSSLAVNRTLDVCFAALWLVALLPPVALAIRLDSPGPVLFRQTRVGRNGRRLRILKFRPMIDGAEAMQAELGR